MVPKAGWSTPLLNVSDVERSIRFYSRLGFETIDVHRTGSLLLWARMHCEGGAIMFSRSENAQPAREDRFALYLYTPDLPALCSELAAAGIATGPISHPEYMPGGEVCLRDPDGYTVFVGHWSGTEDEAWEREREKKRAAGLIP